MGGIGHLGHASSSLPTQQTRAHRIRVLPLLASSSRLPAMIASGVHAKRSGGRTDPREEDMMRPMMLAALMSAVVPVMALAQSADDLKNDDKTPGDVLTYGMGYSQQRYSPLTQINRDTVKRMVPAWSYSMADNRGQEAQPLFKDGI